MLRKSLLSRISCFLIVSTFTAFSISSMVCAGAAQQGSKNISPSVKNSKGLSSAGGRVKFSARGGYSVTQQDTINTYGDSRSLYGSAISFRDPQMDRQSNGGPFDQGFFFDSAITPRGGEAPYLN